MSKICIVADSSCLIELQQAKELGIEIAPLSIILDGKEYQDQVEMTGAQLRAKLQEKAVPKTAQPNLGLLDGIMKKLKAQNYDDIIVFSLTSNLSGTFSGFNLAVNENEMTNVTVVDTLTLAGPVRDIVLKAAAMVKAGASKQEILDMAQSVMDFTVGYLFPETLDQLKRGGRVSPAVATLSSLLKIKPLLVLENKGTTFEKAGTARTEAKIFEMMLDGFAANGLDKVKNGKLVILHCAALETAQRFEAAAKSRFGNIVTEISELPAVLTAHAGLGAISVQSSLVL